MINLTKEVKNLYTDNKSLMEEIKEGTNEWKLHAESLADRRGKLRPAQLVVLRAEWVITHWGGGSAFRGSLYTDCKKAKLVKKESEMVVTRVWRVGRQDWGFKGTNLQWAENKS